MHDVRDAVLLEGLKQARQIQDVAELYVDPVLDVPDQAFIAVTGVDDRTDAFLHELARGLRPDHTHSTGDQHFHRRFSPAAWWPLAVDAPVTGLSIPSGFASTRTNATRATSVPRLNQAWMVPR